MRLSSDACVSSNVDAGASAWPSANAAAQGSDADSQSLYGNMITGIPREAMTVVPADTATGLAKFTCCQPVALSLVKVTEATLVYVATGSDRKPRPLPPKPHRPTAACDNPPACWPACAAV